MIYVIPTAAAILCGISFLFLLRDRDENLPEEKRASEKRVPNGVLLYSGIMVLATVGISLYYAANLTGKDAVSALKSVLLLCVIWPVAYIDFRTYRIPNAFILLGLGCRAVLIPFELVNGWNHFAVSAVSELIAAAALLIASGLCLLCLPGSVGAGDMKLFAVMGIFLGLEKIWLPIFMSLIVAFIIAVYLLVTKKKNRKDAIPFGPAIVLGTYISVCLMGM